MARNNFQEREGGPNFTNLTVDAYISILPFLYNDKNNNIKVKHLQLICNSLRVNILPVFRDKTFK